MTPAATWTRDATQDAWRFYDWLLDGMSGEGRTAEIVPGMVWALARVGDDMGLASMPARVRPPVTQRLARRAPGVSELAALVRAWHPVEAGIGLAVVNAASRAGDACAAATPLYPGGPSGNPVFEHFAERVAGQRVVVVGRQPGAAVLRNHADLTVIDAHPGGDELPLAAADYLLPGADWVFLSATSIADKTFPRLAALAGDARMVLCGEATPWLPGLSEFGVDYLAGVRVVDPMALRQVVAEGGGSRIYDGAVQHALLDLAQDEAGRLQSAIAAVFARRAALKAEMAAWYAQGKTRFPGNAELLRIDAQLAQLDQRYRHVWDAEQARARASA